MCVVVKALGPMMIISVLLQFTFRKLVFIHDLVLVRQLVIG